MIPFGQKKGLDTTQRTLFDQKVLIHVMNSIASILCEIRNAPQGPNISLQQLPMVQVEKKFGVTEVHAEGTKCLPQLSKQWKSTQP
jgi:hypothetical protein